MKVLLKTILFITFFSIITDVCLAKQTRVLVVPVNINTVNSAIGLYPNISDLIANDIINSLNQNLNFDVPDLNTAENLITSHGLWKEYRNFLKNYKDRRIIDYKICGLLRERLGIDKILLVSSGFSMQSMVLKRPFLYKIGFTQFDAVQSFYRMDVLLNLIDTQTLLVDFDKTYDRKFKVKNFEIPSNSLSDNVVSTKEIKKFSDKIAEKSSQKIFEKVDETVYTNVRSMVLSNSHINAEPTEGVNVTTDGPIIIEDKKSNEDYLKNKRKESFENWIREKVDF